MAVVDTGFELNWRRQQELRGQPMADAIYRDFLHASGIKRFEMSDQERLLLDVEHGIDCVLTLPTGQIMSVQEKFLSGKYAGFGSVTFEHYQDWQTGEQGDWFRLIADMILVAYYDEDESGFAKWALISTAWLKLYTNEGLIEWQDNQNDHDGARASFRWVRVKDLPPRCIVRQFGFLEG